MGAMTTAAAASGCGGEGCGELDPWPLHHVRYRGTLRRLCTSCLLGSRPGAFCCSCFEVLEGLAGPPGQAPMIVHCARCPAAAHAACLPSPDAAFVCPACAAGSDGATFSYFSPEPDADGRRRIDEGAARALLAAAQLAATSMSRAAAAARADAERKVKEAAAARKRAREMLGWAIAASKKVKEEKKPVGPTPVEVSKPRKKTPMVQKHGVQSREREKWMRFHEPIAMAQGPLGQGVPKKDTVENPSVAGAAEVKDRVVSLRHPTNNVGQEEKDKNGILMGSHAVGVKEEEMVLPTDANLGPRIPQPTQDASVSRSNSRAILTGPSSTASLHS